MNSDTKTRKAKLLTANIKMSIEYFHSISLNINSKKHITIPRSAAF
ncbi:hypothetical protein JCM19296_2511 [Nonlabens ulvanivorans]|uniref:Uncharacterized protein n=1 Tax=Nonlabens ulvanivorans TaxID=906888 RepID=A0A081DDB5_NONUL|nr:hypothetical protein JCM19296_2511 [Nonlabens ulvanivorans]